MGNSEVEVNGNAEIKSNSVQRKAGGGSGFLGGREGNGVEGSSKQKICVWGQGRRWRRGAPGLSGAEQNLCQKKPKKWYQEDGSPLENQEPRHRLRCTDVAGTAWSAGILEAEKPTS